MAAAGLKLGEKRMFGGGMMASSSSNKGKMPTVHTDVEMARHDAIRVCNPDIIRPFSSFEDACERLLPFHVLADYDTEEITERGGQLLTRSQLWNDTLAAKITEFKSTFEKQIERFNMVMKKQADGDFRMEERWMIEHLMLQEEKQKLIDIKIEVNAKERAEREAEVRTKEDFVQAERARAEVQAQAEAQVRAEAARFHQAEVARRQAEAVRLQVHAEAVRQHNEAGRLHAHARFQQPQVEAARIHHAQTNAEALQYINSHIQADDTSLLEGGAPEQCGMVEEMLESWEPLNGDVSNNPSEDLFPGEVHGQSGVGRSYKDMGSLAGTMQGEWNGRGTLDLNSFSKR